MPLISKTNGLKENLHLVFEALKRATTDKDHPFRFLTLGTASGAGIGLRKVVLRKVDEQNHCSIYTDKRSGKIADLKSRYGIKITTPQILISHKKHHNKPQ